MKGRWKSRFGKGLLAGGLLAASAQADYIVQARRSDKADPRASAAVLRCWPQGLPVEGREIAVLAQDGRALGHRVVWGREGDPLDLRFDCADGVQEVSVRIRRRSGDAAAPPPAWEDRAGVLLETRRRVSDAVDSWSAVQEHWRQAGAPLGRTEVDRIFDGIHRHGPTADFLSHYQAWVQVPETGRIGFATISDDASFLLVNGAPVAEWPGWHGLEGGRQGQHHGWVQLNAGLHRIDYYNVQNEAGFSVAAAWRLPGKETFELIPAEAFAPTARFEVTRVEEDDPSAFFQWETGYHVRAGPETLLEMHFAAAGSAKGDLCRWSFPDGSVREGAEVAHVFRSEELAPVTLEVMRGGRRVGQRTHPVRVKPDWSQRAEFDDKVYAGLLARMPDEVFARLSPEALASWLRWADALEDRALLTRLADIAVPKAETFKAPDADALYRLGFHLQVPASRRYGEVRTVWSAVLKLEEAAPELKGRTALHLGGMKLHVQGDVKTAERLLAEADRRLPAGDDRRLLEIYRGDAAAVDGRLEAAREAYLRAGTVVDPDNLHYEVRRVERMERARRFLAAGEHDAAERVVREIEWERPMERMGLETGLLLARTQLARGETELALGSVRRLRNVGAGDPLRPELLWFAAQLLRSAEAAAEADSAVEELLRDYPYSEAAAWAQAAAGSRQ